MALQLYGSNLLESLVEKLHQNFDEEHNDVFQPDYIITQTEGMKNWLLIQLAEKAGIAANIKFLSPNDLIFQVAQIVGGGKFSSLSSNVLCWIIFSILKENEFVKKYPEIAAYYNADDNPDSKRIALAEKIADLFDQYQIYRHDYIEQWNLNMNLQVDNNWQE
ncbi:MAG: exodeoxyribonuclease V subunit gamma, partial [Ferruginibacter sp.]